jgi:hypothetical protein
MRAGLRHLRDGNPLEAQICCKKALDAWILLPYTPDWRWPLDRDDSPWYPSVRLFRQDETRDYASVVARVRSELTAMISVR